jgi:hypothetical protein
MTIEKNATLTAKSDINLGYVSAKSAEAKIDIETASREKISVSTSEYKFSKDAFTDGTKFIFTVPRIPGEIHFGKNSTILSIETWTCGYNVTNMINYEYVGSAVNPESFGFSDAYGGIHKIWWQDGTEFNYNNFCNDYMYLGLYTSSAANRLNGYLLADSTSAAFPTKFLFNQSAKRGASNSTDLIYYGYPWIISIRYAPEFWAAINPSLNNGNQISSPCGDDMTGFFTCELINSATSRRYIMVGRDAADTVSYMSMFDKNYINSTNEFSFLFVDSAYDYVMPGTDITSAEYFLPAGISYALQGYMTFSTTHEESYYGNLSFDHFMVYPNPTVTISGSDAFLFNNFKLIHLNDENGDGKINLDIIPNSLNNGTWWYFDFPDKTIQNLYIDVEGITCYYKYNPATFVYDTLPTCPFIDNVEISTGAGIGAAEITSVALLNYKFSTNSSQSLNVGEYFPPPPVLNATLTCDVCHDLPVKQTVCADNFTLRTIRERTSCVSGACETYNQTDNILCVNGCYEGITQNGAGCAPMNIEVITYAFAGFLILITGIYFVSSRFNRGSKKAGRF